ncbi:MAG TPA: elongation factor P [Patescibacteria group bacterium]
MLNSTELKNGVTFLRNNKPYKVVKYSLIKMGRGGATVKLLARNLENGATEPLSLSSNVKVEDFSTQKRRLQYLYKDAQNAVFMNPESFEQVEIPLSVIGDDIAYIKEGSEADVLYWEEKALSIDLPPKIVLEVVDTDPGVKGNSASNIYKSATLENGLNVKVPLFIKAGEKVRVDTRTGEYIERAK